MKGTDSISPSKTFSVSILDILDVVIKPELRNFSDILSFWSNVGIGVYFKFPIFCFSDIFASFIILLISDSFLASYVIDLITKNKNNTIEAINNINRIN